MADKQEAGTMPGNEGGVDQPGPRPRGALTNASWNAFATIWGIVISFVTAPVLIHKLGTADYGILLLIWSVTGLLGLVNVGLPEGMLRYVAYHHGRGNMAGVNRVMQSSLAFYCFVCLLVILGLFLGAPALARTFNVAEGQRQLFTLLLRLSAVVFALRVMSGAYGAIPMALHRYDISSKFGIIQNVVRASGSVALAASGFGLLYLILWELLTQLCALGVSVVIVRKIAPGASVMPGSSFKGLGEIFSFSVFSFLTYLFFMMHKESGKMVLGAQLGPVPVAYLGTPDNVAQRLHGVISSGGETLMPRFSANRDRKVAQELIRNATWASLAVSLVFLLPVVVLMSDFLRLWISPEFSRASAVLGQLVALSYISQGAYAPVATYFRGTGKPWIVTITVCLAGVATLVSSLLLLPRFGVLGIGYAYLIGSIPALLGLLHGWLHLFGRASMGSIMRLLVLPCLLAGGTYVIEQKILDYFPEPSWFGLFNLGALFFGLTGFMVFGADWLLGGSDAPSRQFLVKLGKSERLAPVFRLFPWKRAR